MVIARQIRKAAIAGAEANTMSCIPSEIVREQTSETLQLWLNAAEAV